MHLCLIPFVSSRLGLPIASTSVSIVKSYEPDISKQLAVLLRKLPQFEELA
jgi:hypothetical protein